MESVVGSIILSATGACALDASNKLLLIPCDGRTLSVGQYPQMALAWAATPQDPSSTFTVPDLRAVAPVCQNTRRRLIYSTPASGYTDSLYPGSVPIYDDWDVDWPTQGTITRFPSNFWGPMSALPCDGSFVQIQFYQALYSIIGHLFWGSGSTDPQITQTYWFRMPNLATGTKDIAGKLPGRFWMSTSGIYPTERMDGDWGTA